MQENRHHPGSCALGVVLFLGFQALYGLFSATADTSPGLPTQWLDDDPSVINTPADAPLSLRSGDASPGVKASPPLMPWLCAESGYSQ